MILLDNKQVVVVGQEKGHGVVAAKPFTNGQFVCEYAGDLLTCREAQKREEAYASENDRPTACYMY